MTVSDWDHRELCPDGACVGVIGPEGTCRVCGRAAPNWGDERTRGLVDSDDADDLDDDVPAIAAAATARRLCPDGACVGLIGPDGRCKVCGTPASASPSEVGAADHAEPSDDDVDEDGDDDDDAHEDEDEDANAPVRAEGAAPPARGRAPDDDDDADDDNRRLCPDGACIGVLGADGRCKVCGKAAE